MRELDKGKYTRELYSKEENKKPMFGTNKRSKLINKEANKRLFILRAFYRKRRIYRDKNSTNEN